MAKKEIIELPPSQLSVGMYVDLDLPWAKNPFLFAKFKVKSKADLTIIRGLGLKAVRVHVHKSDAQIPAQLKQEESSAEESQQNTPDVEELLKEKRQHMEMAEKYRERRREIHKVYNEQAALIGKVVKDLKTQPANAIANAGEMIDGLAEKFDGESELFTNLVNLGSGDHTLQNHAVNVTVLSLMVASAEGMRGSELRQVALGALLHDMGKIELPSQIQRNTSPLTPAEKELFKRHTLFGAQLTQRIEKLPQEILDIIQHHHEFLDGTGYPDKLKGTQISKATRIVVICNLYDNLCNPPRVENAMTPKDALAVMFKKYAKKIDANLVERFIRTVGVYPPGTVVQLNDETIGLVVTVDPSDLLNPELMLYNPDIPKKEAMIANLKEHPDLKIEKILRPGEYPKVIYDYLGIEERIGFYVESK